MLGHELKIRNYHDGFPISGNGHFNGGASRFIHHRNDETAHERRRHIVRMSFDFSGNIQHFILRKRRSAKIIRQNHAGDNSRRRASHPPRKGYAVDEMHFPRRKFFTDNGCRFLHGAKNDIFIAHGQNGKSFAFGRKCDIPKIPFFRNKMHFIV